MKGAYVVIYEHFFMGSGKNDPEKNGSSKKGFIRGFFFTRFRKHKSVCANGKAPKKRRTIKREKNYFKRMKTILENQEL